MRALRVLLLMLVVGVVAALITGPAQGDVPRPEASAAAAAGPDPALARAVQSAATPAAAAVAAFPTLVPGTPCLSTARACIDLSAKRTWLLSGGRVVYGPVPITSGRPGFRTPTGTFRVSFKDVDHRSSLFNDAPMPYSVFFNGGIAFHQGSLRVPSHGCIHLSAAAARAYFSSLRRGDIVQVTP